MAVVHALAGHEQRHARRVGADGLGGDLAGRVGEIDAAGGAEERLARGYDVVADELGDWRQRRRFIRGLAPDLGRDGFPLMLRSGCPLRARTVEGAVVDVGTPEGLALAERITASRG